MRVAWQYWATEGVVDGGNWTSTPDGSCSQYSLPPCEHHIPKGHYAPCPSNEYPTPACPTTCANGKSFSASKVVGASAYSVSSDPNAIATEIMTNGPVEVAFTVYEGKSNRPTSPRAVCLLGSCLIAPA